MEQTEQGKTPTQHTYKSGKPVVVQTPAPKPKPKPIDRAAVVGLLWVLCYFGLLAAFVLTVWGVAALLISATLRLF